MKEVIKGWVARDKGFYTECAFFSAKPRDNYYGWYLANAPRPDYKLDKKHGLKPGEIKRATLTVEVNND